jgi:hypothetical protein
VIPFRAWHLPRGFNLAEEEVSVVSGEAGREFVYPVLSRERTDELMALLRRARDAGLADFPVDRVVKAVGKVAGRLLDPGDGLRGLALRAMAPHAGYSPPMAAAVLDGMARLWTDSSLNGLLDSEFRDPEVLDGFVPVATGQRGRALGYPLTLHLGAGTVPGVSTTSMVRALLVKSAVLLKPGLGDLSLPVVFAGALEEEDPELASSIAVAYWPSGEGFRTEMALNEADLVTAYGSDETIRWVRAHLPARTILRAYRHRLGAVLIGRGALGGEEASYVAQEAARAVALFDQRGCVSPHVFFVERGGQVGPEAWAELLSRALSDLETELPSGDITPEEAVAVQQLRGSAELVEGLGSGVVFHGEDRAPWTVTVQAEGPLEPSCLNRTVRVFPVEGFESALDALREWSPFLQTVGLAGFGVEKGELAEELARLGVSRIVPLAQVPWPPPWWHHDGSGPLLDLVRWTDLEGSS